MGEREEPDHWAQENRFKERATRESGVRLYSAELGAGADTMESACSHKGWPRTQDYTIWSLASISMVLPCGVCNIYVEEVCVYMCVHTCESQKSQSFLHLVYFFKVCF